jgi:hypothetical protein
VYFFIFRPGQLCIKSSLGRALPVYFRTCRWAVRAGFPHSQPWSDSLSNP